MPTKVKVEYERDVCLSTLEKKKMSSSFSLNKLRNLLPAQNHKGSSEKLNQRHSVSLEPEIGFQLTLCSNESSSNGDTQQMVKVPELNINLIAARHLPSTFGFKVVQGYEIKVCALNFSGFFNK